MPPDLDARRRAVVDRPWSWLRQVHGSRVVTVDEPGGGAGSEADAAVSAVPGTALVVFTADCAPVVFASDDGVIGIAHAGWRGLLDGVIDATVDAMRVLTPAPIRAALGPCIHPSCYEFSPADLDKVAAQFGDTVRSTTPEGHPALDVPEAVRIAVRSAGVELVGEAGVCTACSPVHFSHRGNGDPERQAAVVWRP